MSVIYAGTSSRRVIWSCIIAAVVFLTLYWTGGHSSLPSILPTSFAERPDHIPNIVHFTHLKKDDNSELHFTFQSLLSLYSAIHYLRPDRVYVHTDFNTNVITEAKSTGSKWTRMILTTFPEVQFNQVIVPTHVKGLKIDNIEAKSDLVRWEQVNAFGGIYLDWDVITLRDVGPLRYSGFNNIVGRQWGGKVNSGCFMCKKESALAQLMVRDQYRVFDNGWETHSVQLVTDISERLVRTPHEVLIMDQAAMGPTNWEAWSADALFGVHNDTTIPMFPQVNDPTEDPRARWDDKSKFGAWEMDFSATYFLHAFQSRGHRPPDFDGVSVKYVLARNSNFALAAWPVVQAGIRDGIFVENDAEV